jgi:hypothetical protein
MATPRQNRAKFGLGRRRNTARVFALLPRGVRKFLPKRLTTRTSRYWYDQTWWLDQQDKPHCVGFAWMHRLTDGPETQLESLRIIAKTQTERHKKVTDAAHKTYHLAQQVDQWPGEDYDGTSVRAGAAILKVNNIFGDATWTVKLQDLIDLLLNKGPVVVGTNWYDGMFEPDENGVIAISGDVAGGHAYVVNGVNTRTRMFRIKNSWGRSWGKRGRAYISFEDMERLLKEEGECVWIEEFRIPRLPGSMAFFGITIPQRPGSGHPPMTPDRRAMLAAARKYLREQIKVRR